MALSLSQFTLSLKVGLKWLIVGRNSIGRAERLIQCTVGPLTDSIVSFPVILMEYIPLCLISHNKTVYYVKTQYHIIIGISLW
jgi:hypothetical protein